MSFQRTADQLQLLEGESDGLRLPIRLTTGFFRTFICPPSCFVCCARLSVNLDYLPTEPSWLSLPMDVRQRFDYAETSVREKVFPYWSRSKKGVSNSEPQTNEYHRMCPFLGEIPQEDGEVLVGCSLWPHSPLACRSAYQINITEYQAGYVVMNKRGVSRKWRYDPQPECAYDNENYEDQRIDIDLMHRFLFWSTYLELETASTRLRTVIDLLEQQDSIPQETLVVL